MTGPTRRTRHDRSSRSRSAGVSGVSRDGPIESLRVGPLPVWGWALLTGLGIWALYLLTLAPSTAFWDASEYITTAHILGIPHPPSNPFFVVIGRVWDAALSWTGLPVAVRINSLSATASAGSAAFFFLALARVGSRWWKRPAVVVVGAATGVLVGATAFTVWYQSDVNAKVYTVSLLFIAVLTYLAMVWRDAAETPRGDRLVLLVAFLLGLGAANHLMSVLPLLGLVALVLWRAPRTLLRGRLLAPALILVAAGYSLQVFFLPIRASRRPIIDEGNPTCRSLARAAVTPLHLVPGVGKVVPASDVCMPLLDSLTRAQYPHVPITERQSPFGAQLENYAQYFGWQWARDLPAGPRAAFTALFLLLGMWGLWRHWKGDRESFVYFFTLLLTVAPLLVFYMNFKYGYSQHPEISDLGRHEVRERDYFFIVSFYLWGMYAGLGLVSAWTRLAERASGLAERARKAIGDRGGRSGERARQAGPAGPVRAYWGYAPVLLIAFLPLALNWSRADRRGDYSARNWAYNLLQSVEPYGVLFTYGDNDTFPLWYAQEVEGVRRDVTVVVHTYLGTDWYPGQLRDLDRPCPEGVNPAARPTVIVCQRPFDEADAVAPYRGLKVRRPTRSILALPDSEIRRLPPAEVVDSAVEVPLSTHITARVRGRTLLTRGDLLVFLMTRTALGDRPVYFSSTAPPAYEVWGLAPHLLQEGLADRLVNGDLEPSADTVRIGDRFEVPWEDVPRSRDLLWNVYDMDDVLRWKRWPEPSTRVSIPYHYYLAYYSLAAADRLLGRRAESDRSLSRAATLLRLTGLE